MTQMDGWEVDDGIEFLMTFVQYQVIHLQVEKTTDIGCLKLLL